MKFALQITFLLLVLTIPIRAHEVVYRTGIFCEQQNQAERLIELADGDVQTAIAVINSEEHNPSACSLARVAYVNGARLAIARSKVETFEIIEVLVIGVATKSGFRSAAPAVYFMLSKIDERVA